MEYNPEILNTVVANFKEVAKSHEVSVTSTDVTVVDGDIKVKMSGNRAALLLAKLNVVVPEMRDHIAEAYTNEFTSFLAFCAKKPIKKVGSVKETGASLEFVQAMLYQYLLSQYETTEHSMETE
ncbi:hypothetical protein HXX76_014130 [Chlamydomonas incerta]|uniref:Uncharacterized protein n=1 Tax=Chlamydomonas incerta TaxID=51695 RepID=A0A835SCX0_CHLIN|nr:hypothetical protein HXX76_014130 [Chlamydomonas incerta]|eukprot:KAG2424972.1 hypothetical protein HXX76_014130 [Chlamydomonas incerta]